MLTSPPGVLSQTRRVRRSPSPVRLTELGIEAPPIRPRSPPPLRSPSVGDRSRSRSPSPTQMPKYADSLGEGVITALMKNELSERKGRFQRDSVFRDDSPTPSKPSSMSSNDLVNNSTSIQIAGTIFRFYSFVESSFGSCATQGIRFKWV